MRVLVVEDQPKMARLLQRGLRDDGFVTDVCGSGEDALAARVPGIGPRTIDRIRPHLFAVGPDPACGVGES